jgi:hypothetical protein
MTFMHDLSLQAANAMFNGANIAVIVGSVLVLIGAIAIFWSVGIKERYADERASKNEADTANANARAAEADKRAAEATLQVAQANERIAELNKAAETARLETLKIQQRLAPRTLTHEQIEGLTTALKPFSGQKLNAMWKEDPERIQLGSAICGALAAAGWVLATSLGEDANRIGVGILVEVASDADARSKAAATALANALKGANLSAFGPVPMRPTGGGISLGNPLPDAKIMLTVGTKPQ